MENRVLLVGRGLAKVVCQDVVHFQVSELESFECSLLVLQSHLKCRLEKKLETVFLNYLFLGYFC